MCCFEVFYEKDVCNPRLSSGAAHHCQSRLFPGREVDAHGVSDENIGIEVEQRINCARTVLDADDLSPSPIVRFDGQYASFHRKAFGLGIRPIGQARCIGSNAERQSITDERSFGNMDRNVH